MELDSAYSRLVDRYAWNIYNGGTRIGDETLGAVAPKQTKRELNSSLFSVYVSVTPHTFSIKEIFLIK